MSTFFVFYVSESSEMLIILCPLPPPCISIGLSAPLCPHWLPGVPQAGQPGRRKIWLCHAPLQSIATSKKNVLCPDNNTRADWASFFSSPGNVVPPCSFLTGCFCGKCLKSNFWQIRHSIVLVGFFFANPGGDGQKPTSEKKKQFPP